MSALPAFEFNSDETPPDGQHRLMAIYQRAIYQKLRAINAEISVSIEVIWPDWAQEVLDTKNGHNRTIKKVHLGRLTDDMDNDLFAFTGATICFDREGTLIDGQHRLMACVASGKPFVSIVVRGLDPKAQDNIDHNAIRSVGDILQLNGTPNGILMGSLAAVDLAYQRHPNRVWNGGNYPSKTQAIRHALEHEVEFQGAIAYARKAHKSIGALATAYAELCVLVQRAKFAAEWHDFHDGVCTGVGLGDNDARLTLRNYVMRGKSYPSSWGRQRELALYIRSFNAYISGEDLKMLKFTKENLPMPKIIGS